jgi:nucleotide-binding universal stress UspA family protein
METTISGTPIVVGYDGSASADEALSWGAAEAARLGAPVRVVHVLEWPVAAPMDVALPLYPDETARRQAGALVTRAVSAIQQRWPGLAVTGAVRVGAAGPELTAESAQARLLVVGHRGRGGFAGLLLGSVGVTVSAQAHCPVAVVRGDTGAIHHGAPVLVGYDDSEPAQRALAVAFRAASARHVGLRVLHAWRPPVPRWGLPDPAPDVEDLASVEQSAVAGAVYPWQRRYPDVPVAVDIVADGAGHALAAASAQAQLVVVGSRGHGGVTGLLLGSVSQQLLRHAACPVIVVHEWTEHLLVSAA